MKTKRLEGIIPDRSNFIKRYFSDDYVYAILFPTLPYYRVDGTLSKGVVKIGISRSNPWKRLRAIVNDVAKKLGNDKAYAVDGRYVVMSGHWNDEQMIHEELSKQRLHIPELMSSTEWFAYEGKCKFWLDRRLAEVRANIEQGVDEFGDRPLDNGYKKGSRRKKYDDWKPDKFAHFA